MALSMVLEDLDWTEDADLRSVLSSMADWPQWDAEGSTGSARLRRSENLAEGEEVDLQTPEDERFSTFGDHDCGEPQKPQQVTLDFSPDPEFDNPETTQKCIDFWDFINSHPEIHNICVMPDPNLLAPPPGSDTSDIVVSEPAPPSTKPTKKTKRKEKTALTLLEMSNKHDYLQSALDTKLPESHCSLGGYEYEPAAICTRVPEPLKSCNCCKGVCKYCMKRTQQGWGGMSRAACLNAKAEKWDKLHPKSMDPPGPVMQHIPVLVRHPQDPEIQTCK